MKSVVLTIAESEVGKIKSIAEMLKKDGLEVSQILDFGLIFGHAEDAVIKKLREHKEVVSLTEEQRVNIAPPDSKIQ